MAGIALSKRLLAMAVALLTVPDSELLRRADGHAAMAGLRQDGHLDADGRLAAPVADVVGVVARALLRVEVRTADGDAVAETRFYADEGRAVRAAVDGDRVELRALEAREDLPRELVAAVGLPGSPAGRPGRVPVAVRAGDVGAAAERLRDGDEAAALERIRAGGASGADAGAALALAERLTGAFVATAAWREPDGEWHPGTVAALQAGGWWAYDPGDPGRGLEPVTRNALAGRLLGLLP